jgi:hypothetical protein
VGETPTAAEGLKPPAGALRHERKGRAPTARVLTPLSDESGIENEGLRDDPPLTKDGLGLYLVSSRLLKLEHVQLITT